jgi:hypothetical protein
MKRVSGTWPVKTLLNTGVWVSDGLFEGDVMETDEVSEGVVSLLLQFLGVMWETTQLAITMEADSGE